MEGGIWGTANEYRVVCLFVRFCRDENVVKLDSNDRCTVLWVY